MNHGEIFQTIIVLEDYSRLVDLTVKQAVEIDRLRKALKKILNPDNFENIFEIAEAALQQKESK